MLQSTCVKLRKMSNVEWYSVKSLSFQLHFKAHSLSPVRLMDWKAGVNKTM